MEETYELPSGTILKLSAKSSSIRTKSVEPDIPIRTENTPYDVGKKFEDYVMELFPAKHFNIVHKTVGAADLNGRFTEDCVYPDYKFRDLETGRTFWIECKYRSHYERDGSVTWTDDKHLEKYKDIQKKTGTKIYIILGVGGKPSRPEKMYCFDLDRNGFKTLYPSRLRQQEIRHLQFWSLRELESKIFTQ